MFRTIRVAIPPPLSYLRENPIQDDHLPIHTVISSLTTALMFSVVPKGLWERTNPADEKTFVPGPCARYLLKTEIDSY